MHMLNVRKDARCVRKYSLKNGVLAVSCYLEEKCYLRLNVVLETGDFNELFSCINLQDFHDEISIILSVCRELLQDV